MHYYKTEDNDIFSKGKEVIPLGRGMVELTEEEYEAELVARRKASKEFFQKEAEEMARKDVHLKAWLKANPDRLIDYLADDPKVFEDAFKSFKE